MKRNRLPALVASALLMSTVALAGCSKNEGTGPDDTDNTQQTSSIATDPKDSMGPAKPIDGATKGGSLKLLTSGDFEHLDPQRTYTFAAMSIQQLFLRTLTVFREDGKGQLTLVGDLAETPGKDLNGDCKTWEYVLKQGVKFEDGSPITAADVAYGISRSFDLNIDGGATYIQEWLAGNPAFNEVYSGPYSGNKNVPGLQVKDDRTLVFSFESPRCDLPYALALPTSVPVPEAKDTKADYDRSVVSSGPYKIKEYVKDTRLVLERNPNWDPNTDPLRHDYPDEIVVDMGADEVAQTERVIASAGDDANALAWDGVPQSLINQVLNNAELAERRIHKGDPSVWYMAINNQRITDVDVRRAIACAIDKSGLMATRGGEAGGTMLHTLLPTTTIGRVNYANPYDCGPNGNPEKAKEFLKGKPAPELVFLSRTSDFGQATAPIVKESLEKAGFKVVISYNESAFAAAKEKDNPYDIYLTNWGADWPSAVSTIPVLWDGRKIIPSGNSNVAYFNSDEVNKEIDRILAMPAADAGPEWAKLDQLIVEKYCPQIPLWQPKALVISGTKVGGIFISDQFGSAVFYNAHLKP